MSQEPTHIMAGDTAVNETDKVIPCGTHFQVSGLSMEGRDKQTNKWKYKMSRCKVQHGEYGQ